MMLRLIEPRKKLGLSGSGEGGVLQGSLAGEGVAQCGSWRQPKSITQPECGRAHLQTTHLDGSRRERQEQLGGDLVEC